MMCVGIDPIFTNQVEYSSTAMGRVQEKNAHGNDDQGYGEFNL